jgi:PAS domain S-box-containing protein
MHNWLVPPPLQDDYQAFSARVLHYTLLMLLAVVAVSTLFVTSLVQLVFLPVIGGVFLASFGLLHTRRFYAASYLFLAGIWCVITVASFSLNGVRNSSLANYALVIIFSAILISERAVVISTVMSVGALTLLAAGQQAGVLPLQTTELFITDRFFQIVALCVGAGVLLGVTSRFIRRNYQHAQAQELALKERNRALEQEIAERRRAEENLRVSEARYRQLFENIPTMAAVYDDDGRIVLANRAATELLAGPGASLEGGSLRDYLNEADAEAAIAMHTRVLAEGQPSLFESSVRLPNGRLMHFLRHIMPLPHTSPASRQVLAITIDTTDKVRAEREQRELASAREKNAFLTDFFATVSHDLKTPLATMNTSLYLLSRARSDEEREHRVSTMQRQIDQIDRTLQDMLLISRLEYLPTGRAGPVNLNALAADVLEALRPRCERKSIRAGLSQAPALPSITGDEEQLRRMVTNLVENAVNYTPPNGEIRVETRREDDAVLLEVQDTGIGIEQAALPHIFERFYRTDQARSALESGTGLGLAIVHKIVTLHAAHIDVTSQPGAGTTFRVRFSLESGAPTPVPPPGPALP